MKVYVKPTITVIDLKPEEQINACTSDKNQGWGSPHCVNRS